MRIAAACWSERTEKLAVKRNLSLGMTAEHNFLHLWIAVSGFTPIKLSLRYLSIASQLMLDQPVGYLPTLSFRYVPPSLVALDRGSWKKRRITHIYIPYSHSIKKVLIFNYTQARVDFPLHGPINIWDVLLPSTIVKLRWFIFAVRPPLTLKKKNENKNNKKLTKGY